jgi:hypothetical protein
MINHAIAAQPFNAAYCMTSVLIWAIGLTSIGLEQYRRV